MRGVRACGWPRPCAEPPAPVTGVMRADESWRKHAAHASPGPWGGPALPSQDPTPLSQQGMHAWRAHGAGSGKFRALGYIAHQGPTSSTPGSSPQCCTAPKHETSLPGCAQRPGPCVPPSPLALPCWRSQRRCTSQARTAGASAEPERPPAGTHAQAGVGGTHFGGRSCCGADPSIHPSIHHH